MNSILANNLFCRRLKSHACFHFNVSFVNVAQNRCWGKTIERMFFEEKVFRLIYGSVLGASEVILQN